VHRREYRDLSLRARRGRRQRISVMSGIHLLAM
jgi:hypothetical protein